MQNQPTQSFCKKCHRFIRNENYLIHRARCNGQSRISQNISRLQEQQEVSQQRIPCTFCSYPQTLAELDTHPQQCSSRQAQCEGCHQNYPYTLLQQHQTVCPSRRRRIHHHEIQPEINEERNEDPFFELFNHLLLSRRLSENPNRNEPRQNMNRIPLVRFRSSNEEDDRFHHLHFINSFHDLIGRLAVSRTNQKRLSSKQIQELPIIEYKLKQEPELCTICYCQFQEKQKVMVMPCAHIFHPDCVAKWLQKNELCPVCKQSCKAKNSNNSRSSRGSDQRERRAIFD